MVQVYLIWFEPFCSPLVARENIMRPTFLVDPTFPRQLDYECHVNCTIMLLTILWSDNVRL